MCDIIILSHPLVLVWRWLIHDMSFSFSYVYVICMKETEEGRVCRRWKMLLSLSKENLFFLKNKD